MLGASIAHVWTRSSALCLMINLKVYSGIYLEATTVIVIRYALLFSVSCQRVPIQSKEWEVPIAKIEGGETIAVQGKSTTRPKITVLASV